MATDLKSSDGFYMRAPLFFAASAVLASAPFVLWYGEVYAEWPTLAWGLGYLNMGLVMGGMVFFLSGMGVRAQGSKLSRTAVLRMFRACLVVTLASLSVGGAAILVSRVFPEWRSSHIFMFLTGMLSIVVGVPAAEYARFPKPGFCWTCDYDLTGNVSGRCPECGTPIAAGTDAAASPGPAEVKKPQ